MSDLLLTKLLPEMGSEAQAHTPGHAAVAAAAGGVTGDSSSASVQQRIDSLKRRASSHNVLLGEALLHVEDDDRNRDTKKTRQA